MKKFILLAVASVFSISMFAQTTKVVKTNGKPTIKVVKTNGKPTIKGATTNIKTKKGVKIKINSNTQVVLPRPKTQDEIGQLNSKAGTQKEAEKAKREAQTQYNDAKRDVQNQYDDIKNKAAEAFQ